MSLLDRLARLVSLKGALAVLAASAWLTASAMMVVQSGARYVAPDPPSSSLTAALSASRTSCTAPCAIVFDASGTTSTEAIDTFEQVGYSFDFGGITGTWTHSGQSKDVERGGAIAAAVFDVAGTYVVKVGALDDSGGASDGDYDQEQVTITVAAADTTYSGTNTICLSTNTDHTDCPSGATQTSNVTSWPSWTSSRRYLLHAGQDFTTAGGFNILQRNDVMIGKYGSGADPIVASGGAENGNPASTGTTWSERLTVMNLDITGSFGTGNSHLDLLLYQDTIGGIAEFGGTVGFYYATGTTTMKRIRNTFVVECDISGGFNGATVDGRSPVFMGNNIHDPANEHTLRVWQAYKGVFMHNRLADANSGRHHLKMHSGGDDAWNDDVASAEAPASGYTIIAKNLFTGGANDFPLVIGAQNNDGSPYLEGMEYIISEGNHYAQDYSAELGIGGRNMVERGNVNDVGTYNIATGYNPNGFPPGWGESYTTGGAAIATQDPT